MTSQTGIVGGLPATLYRWNRNVVLFVAIAGFLFGQVFNGVYSVAGMLGGIGGVLAGTLATLTSRPVIRWVVMAGCVVGLAGAALHVYDYYSTPHVAGNYYAWFLTLPFGIGLIVILYRAMRERTPGVVGRL
jgi:hypothetical protein